MIDNTSNENVQKKQEQNEKLTKMYQRVWNCVGFLIKSYGTKKKSDIQRLEDAGERVIDYLLEKEDFKCYNTDIIKLKILTEMKNTKNRTKSLGDDFGDSFTSATKKNRIMRSYLLQDRIEARTNVLDRVEKLR